MRERQNRPRHGDVGTGRTGTITERPPHITPHCTRARSCLDDRVESPHPVSSPKPLVVGHGRMAKGDDAAVGILPKACVHLAQLNTGLPERPRGSDQDKGGKERGRPHRPRLGQPRRHSDRRQHGGHTEEPKVGHRRIRPSLPRRRKRVFQRRQDAQRSPVRGITWNAGVAQPIKGERGVCRRARSSAWIECWTSNPMVGGSKPSEPAKWVIYEARARGPWTSP